MTGLTLASLLLTMAQAGDYSGGDYGDHGDHVGGGVQCGAREVSSCRECAPYYCSGPLARYTPCVWTGHSCEPKGSAVGTTGSSSSSGSSIGTGSGSGSGDPDHNDSDNSSDNGSGDDDFMKKIRDIMKKIREAAEAPGHQRQNKHRNWSDPRP